MEQLKRLERLDPMKSEAVERLQPVERLEGASVFVSGEFEGNYRAVYEINDVQKLVDFPGSDMQEVYC